jgi:hypothetical protein
MSTEFKTEIKQVIEQYVAKGAFKAIIISKLKAYFEEFDKNDWKTSKDKMEFVFIAYDEAQMCKGGLSMNVNESVLNSFKNWEEYNK